MKTKVFYALNLITIVFIFSCQKEYLPDDIVVISPMAGTDSNFLYKIYYLEDNGDSTDVETYFYDLSKRLVYIKDSVLDGSSSGYYYTNYYYHGTDSVPYKYVEVDNRFVFDSTNAYFFYDAQGRKIRDSISKYFTLGSGLNDSSVQVTQYQYGPGKIYGDTKTIYLLSSPLFNTEFTKDTATIDLNGNRISSIKQGSSQGLNGTSNYTYDVKKNPFYKLNIMKTFPVFSPDDKWGIGTNNMQSSDEPYNDSGNPLERIKNNFSYQYNSSGYPISLRLTTTTDAGIYNQRVKFLYKPL